MKNIDFIVKSVSKELNLPEEDVKDLLKIYWKEVLDNITSFDKESLYIRKIGTFQISYWLLRGQVQKAIKDARIAKTPERIEKIRNYLRKVLKMRTKVTETNQRVYAGKKNNKKQGTHNGGDQESDKNESGQS